MPEGPEVDIDKLHATIHEEMEREGGRLLKGIALTTALLAALTGNRLIWLGSLLLGMIGAAFSRVTLLR